MRLVYEVIVHGFDHSQYFQGCGVAYTQFTEVATGCGGSPKEAGLDALEQIYSRLDGHYGLDALEAEIEGLSDDTKEFDQAHAENPESELWWYVSIRWRYE